MNVIKETAEVYKGKRVLVKDLKLSTEKLCQKYNISKTTAWRWRKVTGIKDFGSCDCIELISETDKAYLAGLIDADGYITIKKTRNTFYPNVGVAQTKFEALEWMAEKLNATVSFHTRKHKGKPGYHLKQMIVRLHGTRAQLLCRVLLPYLKIKRKQAEIILRFPCDMRSTGLTPEINILRATMRNEIQGMNGGSRGKE